ncbi:MAG: ImmA/IrrE family metallo-endopeptidase [Roseovarius sp.]|nr:ImmA/IrrE family metallo-endopeptidase [Roseovarius sp.]
MAKSIKAPATPAVLAWARETASMEVEEVAVRFRSANITAERIADWENEASEDMPTLAQLKRLSEIYRRPLAVFFLQEAPRAFPVPRDFRRVPGRPEGISPALRFELRGAEERRLTALQLYEELDETPPEFPLFGRMSERPAALADRAREALGIPVARQLAWQTQYEALRSWKSAVEGLGVLVFQIPAIDIGAMRGFSIAEMPLPVVGINRGESPRARIFSIMHELTHLMLRQSGICDFNEDSDAPPETQRIEVFCNAVAAEILAPSEVFLSQPEIASRPADEQEWQEDSIQTLSNRFYVSRTFIVRRLLEHGRCSADFYQAKQALYLRQFHSSRAEPSSVREKWGEKRQRILGDAFTGLVIDTYRSGNLTLSEMLGHLQIKTKHLPQLEARFGAI